MTAGDSRPLSLADEAYAALRARIIDCRLVPGSRVTEKQLAADLRIGLTPVRQALARLDSEDLVRTLPRRGYQVAPLTIESVNELFQAWRVLGPAIAELAGQNAPAAAWLKFTTRLRAGAEAAGRGDGAAFIQAAEESWMSIAEAAGNRRLAAMYGRLAGELRRVFTLLLQDPDAAGALAALVSYETWDEVDHAAKIRGHTERFIDAAHRAVLDIMTNWPSVVQAQVVPPVAWFLT